MSTIYTDSKTNNTPLYRGSGEGVFSSRYFSLAELTASKTAKQRKLSNSPNEEQLGNLTPLATHVLDPLRHAYGAPLYVNSGFRSAAVNAAVGGAKNSQHMRGQAADITTGSPTENRKLLAILLANYNTIPFDQVIAEQCNRFGCPRWIHISWAPKGRGEIIYT